MLRQSFLLYGTAKRAGSPKCSNIKIFVRRITGGSFPCNDDILFLIGETYDLPVSLKSLCMRKRLHSKRPIIFAKPVPRSPIIDVVVSESFGFGISKPFNNPVSLPLRDIKFERFRDAQSYLQFYKKRNLV